MTVIVCARATAQIHKRKRISRMSGGWVGGLGGWWVVVLMYCVESEQCGKK